MKSEALAAKYESWCQSVSWVKSQRIRLLCYGQASTRRRSWSSASKGALNVITGSLFWHKLTNWGNLFNHRLSNKIWKLRKEKNYPHNKFFVIEPNYFLPSLWGSSSTIMLSEFVSFNNTLVCVGIVFFYFFYPCISFHFGLCWLGERCIVEAGYQRQWLVQIFF